ncbi:hypothetical protein BS78_03G406500 [Paspalum vaginatum]|nr:hypothetical protein BS78_03G406500 [Paspalum vaginatum]
MHAVQSILIMHTYKQIAGDERHLVSGHNSDEKGKPEGPKPSDAEKLIEFMENHYERLVASVQSFDEFYHAIFELIEMFCEERGQLQYRIPKKETLLESYNRHHTSEGELTKGEFVEISKEVMLQRESFSLGKATMELAMLLFGGPACALVAKRILPGLGWLPDDVVVPVATSASVAYLIKTKRL